MKNIKRLMKEFQINPTEIIPISNRLYKIHSHNNTFALKQSKLTTTNINKWNSVYQLAHQQQLTSILPVYMTRNGNLFYQSEQSIYYLTPWKDKKETDEPEHVIESFYHELATIHLRTKREIELSTKELEHAITQEKAKTQKYREALLTYIQKFEQRHYMSPFELRVCMQYRDLEHVFRKLDDWYDYYLEDINESNTGYYSLCHGNLRSSHKIYQYDRTFFINWENSYIGSPVDDLARYFYNEFKYHDSYLDQYIESFYIYEKYYPLSLSDRSLLAIYLLHPGNYLHVIDRYASDNWDKAHPFKIQSLEYGYRRLMQGLRMQDYLLQVREQIQEQEESTEED